MKYASWFFYAVAWLSLWRAVATDGTGWTIASGLSFTLFVLFLQLHSKLSED